MVEYIDRGYAGTGIYRENILDHYKNPRNHGKIKNSSIHHKEFNPLCGDEIEMDLLIDNEKRVKDVKFLGRGCAISQASASMLTESIIGKKIDELKKLTRENIFEMLGVALSPVRIKCAVLSLDTLKNAIYIYQKYGQGGK